MKTNRDALLLIAFRLFLKNGYEQTSMQDLVATSGLSKGAFHHYFPRKADLLNACIEHYFGRFLPDMNPSSHQHFEDLVLDGARQYAQLVDELTRLDIPLAAYQRFVWSLLPEHSEAFIERQRKIENRLTQLAEQDLAQRRLKSTNTARTLAVQAMALTEGLGVLWAANPPKKKATPQALFEQTCKAWLNDLS
ncbi:MAG TPA: TetR/AcrR family transcriptional regulator [Saccharospirillum sp.]|nr:TetR/AcrR family transcriptional regulator [Saccharospirillum sp.]